jgi:hypothetical protein
MGSDTSADFERYLLEREIVELQNAILNASDPDEKWAHAERLAGLEARVSEFHV